MKRFLPLFILLIGVVIVIAMLNMTPTPSRKASITPSPLVEVIPLHITPVLLTVTSQGVVTAKQQISLTAEVTGKVLSISDDFVEGGIVKQGTTLLTVDTTDYLLAKTQALSDLAQAQVALAEESARFEQAKEDQQISGGVSVSELTLRKPYLDRAKANVDVAQARLFKAQRDLRNTVIKAPFDGVIKNKKIDQGQLLTTGMSIAEFLGTSQVEIRLPLTKKQRDIITPQINKGHFITARISLTSQNSPYYWQAKAVRADGSISQDTRVQFVTLEVDSPYDKTIHPQPLLIGSFVEAVFEGVEVPAAVRIPREALYEESYVFLLNAKQELEKREVEVLRSERQSVVLSSGINEGDKLVTTRLGVMFAGMKVSVMDADITHSVEKQPALEEASTNE